MIYSYTIEARPPAVGGGWRLRLLEDGAEVGGGVFPPPEGLDDEAAANEFARLDAEAEAADWLTNRPGAVMA